MSLQGYIEEREDRAAQDAKQAARDRDALLWLNQGAAPEQRLLAFDRWLLRELDKRLDWTWAGAHKEKRLHQCRVQIDGMVIALWRRGWMLDGARLAERITGMLDAIGKAQRGGQVRDFWPYFRASVSRYVGLNAEEIQAEAQSVGAAISNVFQRLLKQVPAGPSLPELVAQRAEESLRDRLSRAKAAEARKAAGKDQLPLL